METLDAAEVLSALGHESRLAIFRVLVEAGAPGMNAGAIGEIVGLAPPTLSFHLAHLSRVGLISGRQERRFIYYSANYPRDGRPAQFSRLQLLQRACLPAQDCSGGCIGRCRSRIAKAYTGRHKELTVPA